MPYESQEIEELKSSAESIGNAKSIDLQEKCDLFAHKSNMILFEEFMYASADNTFDLIKSAEKIRSIPMLRCMNLKNFCNVKGERLGEVIFCGNWREIIAQKSENTYEK